MQRRHARTRLVAALGVLLLAVLAGGLLLGHNGSTGSDGEAERSSVPPLRVLNYYPSTAGWTKLWTEYSHQRTVDDFRAIAGLNANTVRVFVHAYTFGYPGVDPMMKDRLADLLAVAHAQGLGVQLSLFDWWSDYTDVAGSRAWLDGLFGGLTSKSSIALVELRNELPVDSPDAANWARELLPEVRRLLPGVPRTLSVAGSLRGPAVRSFFAQFPTSDLDVVSVHFYGRPEELPAVLAEARQVAGKRPVLLGEAGYSTPPDAGPDAETVQADFYRTVADIVHGAGMPPFAPWIYADFAPGAVPGSAAREPREYHFGLRRVDGSWKPAAAVVREMFAANR